MELTIIDKTFDLGSNSSQGISKIELESRSFSNGGEGEVFLTTDKQYVVKIYNESILRQFEHMMEIIKAGPKPDSEYAETLAWPTHTFIISDERTNNSRIGGVVMPNATLNNWMKNIIWYTKFKLWEALEPHQRGDFQGVVMAAYQIAKAIRYLNLKGYGHADLSGRNVLINPVEGRAVVIDLDGLVVPDHMEGSVIGTPGYIAPELVDGMLRQDPVKPTAITDRHALAVLLFQILLWQHPFLDGSQPPLNNDANIDDLLRTSSAHAVYIHHPNDSSNRIKISHIPVTALGDEMVKLFEKVFIEGINDPTKRPHPSEWERALKNLLDDLVKCSNPNCYWGYFPSLLGTNEVCPICNHRTKEPRILGGVIIVRESKRFFYSRSKSGNGKNEKIMPLVDQPSLIRRNLFGNQVDKGSLDCIRFVSNNAGWEIEVLDDKLEGMIINRANGRAKPLKGLGRGNHRITPSDLILLRLGQHSCVLQLGGSA